MQNKLISNVIRIGYTGLHVYAIKKLQNKPIMWPNQLIKESSRLSSLRPSCTLMLFSNITGCIWLKFSKQLPSVESFPYQRQNNFLKVLSKHPLIYRPEWSEFGVLSERDGTVQLFGTKGQKFLYCPGTKGQRDKLKILPRDGTERDFWQAVPSRPGTSRGTKSP